MASPNADYEGTRDWGVSEVKPMTVGDLRRAIEREPDATPVLYDDGNFSWPVDQCGSFGDGFTLFANSAPPNGSSEASDGAR